MEQTFSPSEFKHITGIPDVVYNPWMFRGTIGAKHPACGSGRPSQFVMKDIVRAKIVLVLKDFGMNLKMSSRVSVAVVDHIGLQRETVYVAPNKHGFFTVSTVPPVRKEMHIILDMYNVHTEINKAMEKL